jgi:hypothetical protein
LAKNLKLQIKNDGEHGCAGFSILIQYQLLKFIDPMAEPWARIQRAYSPGSHLSALLH